MRALNTYRVNQPTTSGGFSISITTTLFGTEEEIEYLRKNCEEYIGSGLIQDYPSPLRSPFDFNPLDTDKNTIGIEKIYESLGIDNEKDKQHSC